MKCVLAAIVIASACVICPVQAGNGPPPGPYAALLTDAMSSFYPLRTSGGGWLGSDKHSATVVEGSMAVAQLLAAFRRSSRASEPVGMRDGELRIPEHGNRLPDVLDEARYELEWMLTRLVPEGEPSAGLITDLDGVSVAASLDFAAVAAAGGRYYSRFDRAFIDRLKFAAVAAYNAARAAAPADPALADEFYWAAAELYVTTGKPNYLEDLRASPLWSADVFTPGTFDWNNVGAFARMLLAREPNRLPSVDAAAIRQSVLDAADRLLDQSNLTAGPEWRSTYTAANDALVLASAYDISGHARYRDAAIAAAQSILDHRSGQLTAANDVSPNWNGALSQLAGWLNEQ